MGELRTKYEPLIEYPVEWNMQNSVEYIADSR